LKQTRGKTYIVIYINVHEYNFFLKYNLEVYMHLKLCMHEHFDLNINLITNPFKYKCETSRPFIHPLVWTSCLMHKSVCIWRYILQNYNYKLHFQNLFIYDIPHVSIETLTAENLDVYTTCDLWNSNIQLTMGIDRRWQIYPNVVQLVNK